MGLRSRKSLPPKLEDSSPDPKKLHKNQGTAGTQVGGTETRVSSRLHVRLLSQCNWVQ